VADFSPELVSAGAAVVSAVGGAFAAFAAFRSAASARAAQEAAAATEKRTVLRQVAITANDVLVEVERVESRSLVLKQGYRSLFTFGGSSGGSREALYLKAVDEKVASVQALASIAKPFVSGGSDLANATLEEINENEIKLTQALSQVRATREDLEREHASVEGQCATYRENAIRSHTRQ
jgi:hypothetical protein